LADELPLFHIFKTPKIVSSGQSLKKKSATYSNLAGFDLTTHSSSLLGGKRR
jgi:hypothetical protein